VRASVPDITSQVIGERADGTVDRQKSRRLILTDTAAWFSSGLIRYLTCGGGDKGDSGEDSTHPKPLVRSVIQGRTKRGSAMAGDGDMVGGSLVAGSVRIPEINEGKVTDPRRSNVNRNEGSHTWALEVYKGSAKGKTPQEEHEGGVEIELDEEEVVESLRVLGIALFYSRKSYNSQFLFSDMIGAWGV
jgi:hypothetical protein